MSINGYRFGLGGNLPANEHLARPLAASADAAYCE